MRVNQSSNNHRRGNMSALKQYVSTNPWLLRWVRVTRALIMLGPIGVPLLRLCQRLNKPLLQRLESYPTFAHVDMDQVFNCLEEVGSVHIGHLPAEYVSEILAYCDQNNQTSYWNPHQSCDVIDRIARNAKLLEIVRKYLGVEPRLWLSRLNWTFSLGGDRSNSDGVRPRTDSDYNIHDFHYDTHDFKSLTIFIYLTDVTMDSGPHMFIRGTHKNKTLREIRNISIRDEVATHLYGDKIHIVLGEKGTIFAEDLSCYHKAAVCKEANRLILSLDYVIRNKVSAVPVRTINNTFQAQQEIHTSPRVPEV